MVLTKAALTALENDVIRNAITADRCDGCGRFMSEPARVDTSYYWSGEGPEVNEYHYCARCAEKGLT